MKRSFLLSTAALGIAILPLGAAQADEPYVGAFAGFSTSTYDVFGEVERLGGSISGFTAGGLIGLQPTGTPWHFEGDIGWSGLEGTGSQTDTEVEICVDSCPDVADYHGGVFWHVRALYDFNNHNADNMHLLLGGGIAGLTTSVDYEGWTYTGTSIGPNVSIGLQGDLSSRAFWRVEGLVDFFQKKDLGVWQEEQYDGGPGTVFTGRILFGIPLGQPQAP